MGLEERTPVDSEISLFFISYSIIKKLLLFLC